MDLIQKTSQIVAPAAPDENSLPPSLLRSQNQQVSFLIGSSMPRGFGELVFFKTGAPPLNFLKACTAVDGQAFGKFKVRGYQCRKNQFLNLEQYSHSSSEETTPHDDEHSPNIEKRGSPQRMYL